MKANKRQTAADAVRNDVDRMRSYRDSDYLSAIEERNGALCFSVRYLGDWEVPADEEDDGDYDWKVPTAASRKKLDEMCKTYSLRFGVTVSWHNEGEKEWIGFEIR
jgi:hypothetical protein